MTEIEEAIVAFERMAGSGICTEHDKVALNALRRTAEHDKAKSEGLVVVLPCKVGDTVYRRYMDCQKPYKPTHCTDHEGSCEHCGHRTPIALTRAFDYSMIPLFGKTVFLTRAEAEAALGGGGDGVS